jgi:glycine reductase|tara:strand:- start:127 stop:333 length:207 start_codon:yes stop_codon:yes gene_type:complete
LEKAGIPVCHVTSVVPVAKMVGSNRIVQGQGIVHVMGNADLPAEEEKELRRKTVLQAIEALKNEAPST